MPTVPHYRLTTHFSLGPAATPREEATCTLNFGFDSGERRGTSSTVTEQNMVDDCYTDWATFMAAGDAMMSTDTQLDRCKLSWIGADGHVVGDPVISTGAAVRGTQGAHRHPWQVTCCVTLDHGHRGKGRYGRFYLPPQSIDITNEGVIDPSLAGALADHVKTLIDDLSNIPGIDQGWTLKIAGHTGTSGTLLDVESIRVGHVLDTQRRRRRNLPEAYSVRTVG